MEIARPTTENELLELVKQGWNPNYTKTKRRWYLRKRVDGTLKAISVPRELYSFCEMLWPEKVKGEAKRRNVNREKKVEENIQENGVSANVSTQKNQENDPDPENGEGEDSILNQMVGDEDEHPLVKEIRQTKEKLKKEEYALKKAYRELGWVPGEEDKGGEGEKKDLPKDLIEALRNQISSLEETRKKIKETLEKLGFKVEDMYLHKDEVDRLLKEKYEEWQDQQVDDARIKEVGNIINTAVREIIGLFRPAVQAWFTGSLEERSQSEYQGGYGSEETSSSPEEFGGEGSSSGHYGESGEEFSGSGKE